MCLFPGCAGQLRASCLTSLRLFMSFAMVEPFSQGCGGWDGLVFRGGSRASSAEGCPPGLDFTTGRDLKHCLDLPFQTPAKLCRVPDVGSHTQVTH